MIYIGTSGFSYEDWKGHVYPESTKKSDMLGYYARLFGAVEVNSTYYAIPSAASFAAMDKKTPAGFEFVVKAHQDMTHADKPDPGTFRAFLDAVQPLRDSGKLGCVLAQYPWAFKATSENAARLRELRERVGDVPAVVEFRNSGWTTEDAFALLRELGLGFCAVDEPDLKGLMPPVSASTSKIGYVRFHGRNAQKWWKHNEAYERYDYLYTEDELREWVPRVRQAEASSEKTYVFFNNHYRGKSVENAKMFAKMLGLPLPLDTAPAVARQMTFDAGF